MGNDVERLFGLRVRDLRIARGWSQPELAKRLTDVGHPMTQTVISKLETAARPTSVAEVAAIAAIFSMPIAQLLTIGSSVEAHLDWLRKASALDAIKKERHALAERLSALDEQYATAEADFRNLLQQQVIEKQQQRIEELQREEDR